jgi:glycosyltransferase involved in cell wall biosynthesis
MDLIAEMLVERMGTRYRNEIQPVLVCPPMPRRFARLATGGQSRLLENADRVIGRFLDYPAALRPLREEFDLFHIVDHSYAHLVHHLPAARTVVTCHDVDTFRCLLMPPMEPRSAIFRALTRRILSGLRLAAKVCCVSQATRDDLSRYGIVAHDRAIVIHNGVGPEFSPHADEAASREVACLLGAIDPSVIELLHVGSTIPRKRIDLLLRICAGLRDRGTRLRLIRVGGQFAPEQQDLVTQLGLHDAIAVMPQLPRATLAAIYRCAALLLITSDAEGFGLPLIEALACGTPVAASGIAALREVGADAVEYAPTGDIEAWIALVRRLLAERTADPARWEARRQAGFARAAQFSWDGSVAKTVALYRAVVDGIA